MSNQPIYIAYAVKSRAEGKSDFFVKLGAAFPHTNGKKGLTIQLDALPLNFDGRIVLFEPKRDEAQ